MIVPGPFPRLGFGRFSFGRPLGLLCIALLCACARQPQPVPDLDTPEFSVQAEKAWNRYLAYSEARGAALGPYRLNVSLRYGKTDDTRRVTALIWGNGELPVRLDVMAGLGPLVARLREDVNAFEIYSPREKKALVRKGPGQVLLNFGVPLPFGISDVVALAQGRFSTVFGVETRGDPRPAHSGSRAGTAFTLPAAAGGPSAVLILRPDGLPVRWEQAATGWSVDLGYDDDETPPLPSRVELRHRDGNQAILLVKSRQRPDRPYTARQLELDIPPGTAIEALRPGR